MFSYMRQDFYRSLIILYCYLVIAAVIVGVGQVSVDFPMSIFINLTLQTLVKRIYSFTDISQS